MRGIDPCGGLEVMEIAQIPGHLCDFEVTAAMIDFYYIQSISSVRWNHIVRQSQLKPKVRMSAFERVAFLASTDTQ